MPNAIAPVISAITTLRLVKNPLPRVGLAQAERIVGALRIDLDPLLLRVQRVEVAARGLAHRGALGRLAPDPDLLHLGDRVLEALGDESDDDWCDGGGHDAPAFPQSGTTTAAAAADALAIRSVVTEMPPDFSRLIPPYASETCEPGTMSSRPSGQRTHALCPPS